MGYRTDRSTLKNLLSTLTNDWNLSAARLVNALDHGGGKILERLPGQTSRFFSRVLMMQRRRSRYGGIGNDNASHSSGTRSVHEQGKLSSIRAGWRIFTKRVLPQFSWLSYPKSTSLDVSFCHNTFLRALARHPQRHRPPNRVLS